MCDSQTGSFEEISVGEIQGALIQILVWSFIISCILIWSFDQPLELKVNLRQGKYFGCWSLRARKTRVDDCMYTIGLFMGKECDGIIAGASKFSY